MPKLGLATGEMPHLRWPPKNWMPSQALYYLYTACTALGHDTLVVDANWTRDPIARLLQHEPEKILITTATPTFAGTLAAISALRTAGYIGPIYVSGPHISLNAGQREFLLPALDGVHLIPLINSASTFDWVPEVFPGRSMFEVLGRDDTDAREYVRERWQRETQQAPVETKLDKYIFSYFEPSIDWMDETYRGEHIRPEMREVEIRHSMITSIGCSKTCSFCGNPYIYRIGFMTESTVRAIVQNYKERGITRVSLHDMFFVMSKAHARLVTRVMREEGMQFSMQTCLENLDDELLDEFARSGLQKFLVGIENPVSYSVGKTVELDKLRWLLDGVTRRGFEGVKLSYIVGLPGTSLAADLALLDHIISEITSRAHPLHDLQVNLYTPYRPEPDTHYLSYDDSVGLPSTTEALRIHLLDQLSFRYWGIFPVGVASRQDFVNQMILCDLTYHLVYSEFLSGYREQRREYVEDIERLYPALACSLPSFDASRDAYEHGTRETKRLRAARGNDEARGRRLHLQVVP